MALTLTDLEVNLLRSLIIQGISQRGDYLGALEAALDGLSPKEEEEASPILPTALPSYETELLSGYGYSVDGQAVTIIRNDTIHGPGRFDLGDAFNAVRHLTGWGPLVLAPVTYHADEVRWRFTTIPVQ